MGKALNKRGKASHCSRAHKEGRNKPVSGLKYKRKTTRGWVTERVR